MRDGDSPTVAYNTISKQKGNDKMGIKVLSLFDGMSVGQIALKEMGVDVETYYASEIDKNAIAQTMLNFPNTVQLGSVTEVDARKLGYIDLLIGGSPCFTAGHPVTTAKGIVPIEDIKVGDMVLTHRNRYRKVTAVGNKKSTDVYLLRARNTEDFRVTGNHPFYAASQECWVPDWKKVEDLTTDDYLVEHAGFGLNYYKVISLDKLAAEYTVYNISVDEDESYIVHGRIVHNCQSFSFAGRRQGMSTETNEEIYTLDRYLELKRDGFAFAGESYLFWEYMRILTELRETNPNILFFLENVEMGEHWESVLTKAIGIDGVHINSALVSAQNRRRIYWTNIRTKTVGLLKKVVPDIPQPPDRGIMLEDVLEDKVDEKCYLKQETVDKLLSNGIKGIENVQ